MKILITDVEKINKPFTMDITDFEQEGFDVYCKAHDTWGEESWHALVVSQDNKVLGRMLNSSTLTPEIKI